MADAKKFKNPHANEHSTRRSDKYENKSIKSKALKGKAIAHEYINKSKSKNSNNMYINKNNRNMKSNNRNVPKKKDEKLDNNTLIFLGVIAFIALLIFLKTMGILMTIITIIGIALIIVASRFLKKIRKNRIAKIITNVFTIIFLVCCIGGVCGVLFFAYTIVSDAPTWNTKNLNTKETSILYDSNGKEYAELGTEKRELINYDESSENLINAIIAVEDSRFFNHNGFDPLRFFRASIGQLTGNSNAGGASTISMQVVKNSFTDRTLTKMNSAGIKRKFTDIYLAVFKLEKEYSKEAIFEFYINNHFLGNNSYGVEQAAQTYFGKKAADLTISEAAMIAGMFQAPTTYNPFNNPDKATERRSEVLNLMYIHGYINKEQKDLAESIPIDSLIVENNESTNQKYQSYVDTVITELHEKLGIDPYSTSLKVYTNINTKKQQGLDDIFSGKTFHWENSKVQSGIAAVDVWSGKIVAIAGGRSNIARGLNRAASKEFKKQIGSTAKPIFDYGPAMEYNGYSTYTLIKDEPYHYSSGQPIRNSDRGYMGTMTVRQALAQSRNIPALKTFQAVDNDNIYKFVTGLGITPETSNNSTYLHEAHAIGSFNGSNPLEMAAAYAAFANGGIYYEPYTVNKIVYRDTGETVELKSDGKRVMSDATAFMITYCLRYAVTDGLSKGASVDGIKVAAKTGTTNFTSEIAAKFGLPSYAINDAWIIGYDPDTAVGMWYGYDKYSKGTKYFLKSASSGYSVNAQTERNRLYQTAGKVLFSSKGKDFKVPNSVVKVAVEMGSNPARLASASTPAGNITYEYFAKGTEPTEISTTYNKLSNVSNLKASFDPFTGNVTLSWSAAKKGKDYDESYGNFGYKIYRNNEFITFTTDTSYTVSNLSDPTGTYKVVTTYENYSDTDSSGAKVKLSSSETDTSNYDYDINIGSYEYTIGDTINACLKNGTVNNSCITLYKDGKTVTSGYTVTAKLVDDKGNAVSINKAGTYYVSFTVKYNGANRITTDRIEITVNDKQSPEDGGTTPQ